MVGDGDGLEWRTLFELATVARQDKFVVVTLFSFACFPHLDSIAVRISVSITGYG